MKSTITRRDFLGGTALAIGAGLTPLHQAHGQSAAEPYPPALTGLRGSQPGSFEVAHALAREGKAFPIDRLPEEERYDLIVVGGGISGLAAAWFYRQRFGGDARILIIDNHDDFGGHARRNEFTIGKAFRIGYGGSQSIEAPRGRYSRVSRKLLSELGINIARFEEAGVFDQALYDGLGLKPGLFFDRESFGRDKTVTGDHAAAFFDWTIEDAALLDRLVAELPVEDADRPALRRFFAGKTDHLAGMSEAEKRAYLSGASYRDYLRDKVGLNGAALLAQRGRSLDYFAIATDGISCDDARDTGYPGFEGLGLTSDGDDEEEEPYIYHFPDGDAGIARLLVRKLIPGAAPGHTMEDIVAARVDYAALDGAENAARLRLGSTAVTARNGSGGVDVGYVKDGQLHRAGARHCVLACYNMMVPYLCPDLPPAQKDVLASNVKAPLVYTNVAIRSWESFVRLGADSFHAPTAFFSDVALDFPVSLGGYAFPHDPKQPMLLHLLHVPGAPDRGLTAREQFRIGRGKLLEMSFADFETRIVDQLDRMLGAGGFDAARDIAGITVNRWPHGYAYWPTSIFDDLDQMETLKALGRQRHGNITIANSDAGWDAFVDVAVDQAYRAVGEL
jgi:spermidine dehydrogenase